VVGFEPSFVEFEIKCSTRRHLSNVDCLTARTAFLVWNAN
jgi:hypothetical protein